MAQIKVNNSKTSPAVIPPGAPLTGLTEHTINSVSPPSLYTFSFTFPKGLLFGSPPKELFYRNSLAAREAHSSPQRFDSFFGGVLGGISTLPVCSSREETLLISSKPHPTLLDTMLYCLSRGRPQRPF